MWSPLPPEIWFPHCVVSPEPSPDSSCDWRLGILHSLTSWNAHRQMQDTRRETHQSNNSKAFVYVLQHVITMPPDLMRRQMNEHTETRHLLSAVAEQNRHRKKNNLHLLPSSSQSTTYLHTYCRKAVPKSARTLQQSRFFCPFGKTSDDHRLLLVSSFHQNVAVRRSRCD